MTRRITGWTLDRRRGSHWTISRSPMEISYDLNLKLHGDTRRWQWCSSDERYDMTYQTFDTIPEALAYGQTIVDWLNGDDNERNPN
jgi:hypothetical protein